MLALAYYTSPERLSTEELSQDQIEYTYSRVGIVLKICTIKDECPGRFLV